jgi:zinc finger BED domain-containing protein 5/7/8/9
MCLICERSFSNEAMKPSRLNEHLQKMHPDRAGKDLAYFQSLRDKFGKRPTLNNLFSAVSQQNTDGLRASYNISLLIAKAGKPHSIGEELLVPAISEVITTVMHKSPYDIIKSIPLSNDTVRRRIDEMAEDVENNLCMFLRTSPFSLQLDDSTLPGNESLLLAYARFVKDGSLVEELLFARQLKTNTKGASIFGIAEEFFKEKAIPLSNILSCATDGAPSMIGRYNGFVCHLKNAVPNILSVHCVIHRQHLVAKKLSLRLNASLQTVITSVNKIKSHSLNDRLFRQLCYENDEEFERLLMHTEVRWLSKGNCLQRFYELYDTVVEFFEDTNAELSNELKNKKHDIAYLADLFAKFNEMNLQLQGTGVTLIKCKSIVSAFIAKLLLFERNIGRRELFQFPKLLGIKENVEDDTLNIFCEHLRALHDNMQKRFEDLLSLEVPDWVINPFANIEDLGMYEEELIELQNDADLKPKFKQSYQDFWLQSSIPQRYPALWNLVQKLLIPFPSSYLVERGFSAVSRIITKQRNRMQIVDRGDLRLLLTNVNPDINKLISLHQAHPSH